MKTSTLQFISRFYISAKNIQKKQEKIQIDDMQWEFLNMNRHAAAFLCLCLFK